MRTVGIIAEYNPFHNGHLYQLNHIRKELQEDYIVVAMSGDYVQRGTPALLSKHVRTDMALSCGADLVLEIPVSFSSASADCSAASFAVFSAARRLCCLFSISFSDTFIFL